MAAEQPLQTPWTFWYDRAEANEPYSEALQRLGTVHTVQGFWRYYCNLTRPGQLQPGDNFHLFRGAIMPTIEVRARQQDAQRARLLVGVLVPAGRRRDGAAIRVRQRAAHTTE